MIFGLIYKMILFLSTIKSYNLGIKYSFRSQNYLFIYLLITFSIEIVYFVLRLFYKQEIQKTTYHFYVVFCIIFFYNFFSNDFDDKFKKISFLITFFSIFYILFFTNLWYSEFDKNIGIAFVLFNILMLLLWFYQKISSKKIGEISDDPYFWISSGLLIWSCFFLFRVVPMFSFNKILPQFQNVLICLQDIINILMYSLFYIALQKFEKKHIHE